MSDFRRNILKTIRSSYENPRITLLIGPRQVGKTYLLKQLKRNLKKDSKYFNIEIPQDAKLFNSDEDEIFNIISESGDYCFIDEFHFVKNISKIFKAIYDAIDIGRIKQVKIFASGSSAMEIHKHLKESLAGRYIKFQIRPLNYDEFCTNRDIDTSIHEYLSYGGLPGTYDVHHKKDRDKENYLKQILETYIQKDIKHLISEENTSAFNHLLYILAENQGQIISRANLARDIRVSEKTVERYLDILELTYVIYKLSSYAANLSNELKKSKKYYFYDLGIRNAIIENFKNNKKQKGTNWETFTYHHLLGFQEEANTSIYFWRTSDDLEIDFIWLRNQIPFPIEVKSRLRKASIPKAMETFFKAYLDTPFGIVLNEDIEDSLEYRGKEVHFIRFEDIKYLEEMLNEN